MEELGILPDNETIQVKFVDGENTVPVHETQEDIDSLNDLGTLVEFGLEPESGTYKMNQVIAPGEVGFVQAKCIILWKGVKRLWIQ